LLIENSLRQAGSHLGSFWLRPDVRSSRDTALQSFLSGRCGDPANLAVEFSSRPVQLAKIVSETALMFEHGHGKDIDSTSAKSSIQVSCPVVADNGDRLAPFCYALEVGRSPVVKARVKPEDQREQGVPIHGPVAYTLSIHPPFVIVNLLPERGRFELMHAVRRNVLWFGDLGPGQQMAIHSVGLDAPLLLFLNLGFCRTPVGEGALVHHGADPPPGARGKAVYLERTSTLLEFAVCVLMLSLLSSHCASPFRKFERPEVDRESWKSCDEAAWQDADVSE